ncbi:MAG TPA: hypothetical protein DCF68_23265, partial [Cyanothece sp. UBA12306]|nr:hypothetical protein [Cyanothece sp. UBA12306]
MPFSYIEFSEAVYSAWENDGTNRVAITLTRTGDLSNSVYMDLEILGNNINNVGPLGMLPVYFATGEDTTTVYLDLFDDNFVEGTETVSLSLVNYDPNQVALGTQGTATLNVFDDEVSYIEFSETVFTAWENEQTGQAEITLTRSGNLNSDSLGNNNTATLEVRDDETSYIEFSDVNYLAWENDFNFNSPFPDQAEITLTRTGDTYNSVSTQVEVLDPMGYSMGLFNVDFMM